MYKLYKNFTLHVKHKLALESVLHYRLILIIIQQIKYNALHSMISNKNKGALWMILSLLISCTNDAISKYLDSSMPTQHLIFLRFIIGAITLLPFMLIHKRRISGHNFTTKHIKMHLIRGALLVLAMYMWVKGMAMTSLSIATMMSFSIPFFTLILAQTILNEEVTIRKWGITILGFTGVALGINIDQPDSIFSILLFSVAASIFALLDIINKSLLSKKEGAFQMLFYSNATAAFFLLPATLDITSNITPQSLALVLILGSGGNLILYFILKAYSLSEISHLAPLRYVEFILSTTFGYFLFDDIIGVNTIVGAATVFICALFIIKRSET